ncbi:MAG: TIGR03619 family F420-dependent LLM class oxidoreductase [Alphaproteobacteria bacterium]|nr:TIGR03619 family F420-dependent LLM class oxidoreductase [Alphaproteobacteria bacterium]
MRLGLALPQLGLAATPKVIRRFAMEAEAAGFDSLWVHERLFNPQHPPRWDEPGRDLSPLELLSFAAAVTDRVRLGTSVITLGYHRPIMLAKQAATLDVLSEGRAVLGIGLGLNKEEYRQSDVDYHTRGKRSAEFIHALRACWKDDPVEFRGEFFDIPPASTSPKPVQRHAAGEPAIPIIGGFSSKPGQRRTAELCDGWQTAGKDLETALEQYREADRAAREEFGRGRLPCYWRVWAIPPFSPRQAPKQMGDRVVAYWLGSIAEMAEQVAAARDAGVDEVIMDSNRFLEDGTEDLWDRQIEAFAPLVEVAHGG